MRRPPPPDPDRPSPTAEKTQKYPLLAELRVRERERERENIPCWLLRRPPPPDPVPHRPHACCCRLPPSPHSVTPRLLLELDRQDSGSGKFRRSRQDVGKQAGGDTFVRTGFKL
uniref:Uncharacterized protein n=1 Tax=Fagus sylvatica TaxID=28930 RepID=A0A2N9FDM8_FAGSY